MGIKYFDFGFGFRHFEKFRPERQIMKIILLICGMILAVKAFVF